MCQNITANPMPFFNEALVEPPQRWHFLKLNKNPPGRLQQFTAVEHTSR